MGMPLPQPTGGGDFELAPAGTHKAVCIQVIDLGTQERSPYQGKERKPTRRVRIAWELADELDSEGRRFIVGQSYNFSMNERAALRQDLESWRGVPFQDSDFGPGGFDLKNLLGVNCLLGVVHNEHNERTYANLKTISKMMKGVEPAQAVSPLFLFTLDQFNDQEFEQVPEWLRETIKKSPEYAEATGGQAPPPANDLNGYELDDEVPF